MNKNLVNKIKFESKAKFKHTRQGQGKRSKPSHGRKLSRGQGK